ncbi:abortive infection protein [Sulfurifustis variabilis]|uniref:Abortive infection protein n=2 Tax=Sulfurifustis variabilis TaxID=1675686 RepID=A0A1B4V3T3_9GAMM|nr:abortive infection protein [Sulfurifustis variabilis]
MANRRVHRVACLGASAHAEAIAALKRGILPWLSGATLAGSAAFSFRGQTYILVGLMLVLPLLDRSWRPPVFPGKRNVLGWTALVSVGVALILWQPMHAEFAVSTLLMAGLPEEWFFRAYFLTSIGAGLAANMVTSLAFSVVHALAQGPLTGILVFFPSLVYGWLYQRTGDLPLLVLVHALSNLVFVMFLADWTSSWR